MKDRLEKELERYACTDDASLKQALEELLQKEEEKNLKEQDAAFMDEIVRMLMHLEGIDSVVTDRHSRRLTKEFMKAREGKSFSTALLLRRWLPLAAVLVIVVGIAIFTGFVGRPPAVVGPLTQEQQSTEGAASSSALPTRPPATSLPSVSTAPATSTAAYVPPISYSPGGAQEGGEGTAYNLAYDWDFGAISDDFFELVSKEEAQEWVNSFENGTRERTEGNFYTFLMEFSIPKEKVVEINERYEFGPLVPPEMIERFYTWSAQEVLAYYAFPSTILVGERAYTPKWLVEHSAQQAQEAGITSAMLAEKFPAAGNACRNWKQLEALSERLGELREREIIDGEKGQTWDVKRWIETAPRAAAGWLAVNSPEAWMAEGVELSLVEENLKALVYSCKDRAQIGHFVHRLRQVKQTLEPEYVLDYELVRRCYEQGLTIQLAEEHLEELLFACDEEYSEEYREKWPGGFMVMLRDLAKSA